MNEYPVVSRPSKRMRVLVWALVLFIAAELGVLVWMVSNRASELSGKGDTAAEQKQTSGTAPAANKTPKLNTEIVLGGREHIWEIAFLPTKEMLFSERKGTISIVKGGQAKDLGVIAGVHAVGEGGLLGLAVDSKFNENHYIYTCFNAASDIRVARFTVTPDLDALTQQTDIVTGIPANPSGRHSGCRVAFGPDGFLWVSTGDSAQNLTPQPPQDPKSLGGKILRVARDGRAASNNLGGVFDPRVYSFGHRNVQGMAFFKQPRGNNVIGVSSEHGTDVDDELNPLVAGNFGWAPADGAYNEDAPMTDSKRFPEAIKALWSSDSPTQAPSGVAIMQGAHWKAWDGAVAMAMLKDTHLKILTLDDDLEVVTEDQLLKVAYGRLRAVTMGPDGSLYVGSSNGSDDKILRITPQ